MSLSGIELVWIGSSKISTLSSIDGDSASISADSESSVREGEGEIRLIGEMIDACSLPDVV